MTIQSQTEALKMALEAFEAETDPKWECNSYHPKIYEAITAIKEALMSLQDGAQQSKSPQRSEDNKERSDDNEQVEPVAWYRNEDIFGNQEMEPIFYATKAWVNWLPLYTHPPVPTAQPKPLTFEQVEDCFPEGPSVFEDAYGNNNTSPRWLHAFARAIEVAHGIKGEA